MRLTVVDLLFFLTCYLVPRLIGLPFSTLTAGLLAQCRFGRRYLLDVLHKRFNLVQHTP